MVFKENPTKIDDLGVLQFQETSTYIYIYVYIYLFKLIVQIHISFGLQLRPIAIFDIIIPNHINMASIFDTQQILCFRTH